MKKMTSGLILPEMERITAGPGIMYEIQVFFVSPSVKLVSQNWMPGSLEMNPDLVCPPCMRLNEKNGITGCAFKNLEIRPAEIFQIFQIGRAHV